MSEPTPATTVPELRAPTAEQVLKCPDCPTWVSRVEDARRHMEHMKHGPPVILPLSVALLEIRR